jgi:hypothetical protein
MGSGLLGSADDAKFDVEMVVPEVALIGRTTKRADCDQENIIIIKADRAFGSFTDRLSVVTWYLLLSRSNL